MNEELNGLVQDVATALIDVADALKAREITPDELLRQSKDLRTLSRTTKYLAEFAQLLNR